MFLRAAVVCQSYSYSLRKHQQSIKDTGILIIPKTILHCIINFSPISIYHSLLYVNIKTRGHELNIKNEVVGE
jgi:hypothetical protein